ncbi:MAG: hypothetical protein ABH804_03025 [archaeon]
MKNKILIHEASFEKARKEIRKNKDKKIIFTSEDDELNRKIIEKEKIEVLLLSQKNRKDFQKQRDSGFNHVMAKIAKKNKVIIGINLDEIIFSEKMQKAKILARVQQNIKVCNKNKLKMEFISAEENSRNLHDLKALGLVLKMPTSMVKFFN